MNAMELRIMGIYDKDTYTCVSHLDPHREYRKKRNEKEGSNLLIKTLVMENFDRIVMLLEDEFEVYLSECHLRRMLNTYACNNGYLYYEATAENYPWAFKYMTWRKPIFGLKVKEHSELYEALKLEPEVCLTNGRINSNKNKFLDIAYYNMNHQVAPLNADEFMDYYIFIQNEKDKDRTAYKKRIVFDYDKYERIKATLSGSNRNQRLLDLAREYLG